MSRPDEPTDDEVVEAALETVAKATIRRLREQHGMSRGVRGFLFPGGAPAPEIAERMFAMVSIHDRRDD